MGKEDEKYRQIKRTEKPEKPGEHAKGTFHVKIGFDEEKDRIDLSVPFFLWEKDIERKRKKDPLFAGYPTDIRIDCLDEYREAWITVNSGTILLDEEKRNRAFQSPDQGTGGTAIQYAETDWEFLKRLASRCNLPLVADSSYYFPRFYIGMPRGEERELTEVQDCAFCLQKYYQLYGKCSVDRKDFICYHIKTGDRFCLGDHVRYEGKTS